MNWNTNWSSVPIAGTEQTTRLRRERRAQWPFIRDTNRTTQDFRDVSTSTRTGIRSTLVPGGLQTQSLGNRVVQVAFATFMRTRTIYIYCDFNETNNKNISIL